MADSDEMENLLDDTESFTNGCCSQGFPESETFSAGALPDNRDSEATSSGLHSLKHSRKKVETRSSARLAKYGQAQGGPSAGSLNSGGQFKLPKPKIDLRALFDYHFRRRQYNRYRKQKLRERKAECKTPQECMKTLRRRIPTDELKRQYKERGLQFPLVEKFYGRKHPPLKMVYLYEQAAFKGYFKYIEMLKYEHHLKKSLTQLDAGDDLENECLELRKHKYLDDDGPLSPIEETNGDDPNENPGDEEIGAKIVENSCFILSSKIPKKKKSKKKTK